MRLAKVQKPGDATPFIISATSLMINIPLLMVYPEQTVDKNTNRVTFNYKEMALCHALSQKIWSQYPIKLIFNGIDHYFLFINNKIGIIANLGNPVVTGLNDLCQDFEILINEVPDNTTLKAGLNEMLQHMKVAQKVGDKLSFTKGTSEFTNEPATEPPEVPDPSPVKSIKLCKRRKSISDEEEEAEHAEKDDGDNDGNKGGGKGEKPSVEEQGEPAPKKKKMECERANEQCYCGKKFETIAYLNLHIQRKHKTTWMCSRSNWIEPVESKEEGHWEDCREVCSKRNSLWSHFRRKHERRYHNYCLIGDCHFGSDEEWNINMHRFKHHNIKLPEEQKCLKCGQGFSQIGKYKTHVITCKTDVRPFICDICNESFRQKPTYNWHMQQKHKRASESADTHFFFCSLCGKKLHTLTGKKSHEALPHDKDGNFIKHKNRKDTTKP